MLQLILSIPGELISVVLLSSAHRSRLISQSFAISQFLTMVMYIKLPLNQRNLKTKLFFTTT